jgi:competence ComEA-like helix-hairpin-helix protein
MGRAVPSSSRVSWLLALGWMAVAASLATAAAVRQDKPNASHETAIQSEEELAKIGELTVNKACGNQCHGLENLETRRTVDGWNSIVKEMVDRGALVTDNELAIVKQYLKRYYGVIAVNTAPADELSAVLGLSPKDAKAIVDYRTAHGKFVDVDALLKVPGIDKTKIDEQPQALRFK